MSELMSKTPGELLRLFQPRFRQIALVPKGFGKGQRINQNHFIFRLKHGTAKDEIHPNYYRDGQDNGLVLFDVKMGRLAFPFQYDPENALHVDEQVDAAAGKAILDGPLARTFYVDAAPEVDIASVFYGSEPDLTLSFSGDQQEIPGLILPKKLQARTWDFFIPDGTPEHKAVSIAFQLAQRKQALQQARVNETAASNDAADLEGHLEAALKLAA